MLRICERPVRVGSKSWSTNSHAASSLGIGFGARFWRTWRLWDTIRKYILNEVRKQCSHSLEQMHSQRRTIGDYPVPA